MSRGINVVVAGALILNVAGGNDNLAAQVLTEEQKTPQAQSQPVSQFPISDVYRLFREKGLTKLYVSGTDYAMSVDYFGAGERDGVKTPDGLYIGGLLQNDSTRSLMPNHPLLIERFSRAIDYDLDVRVSGNIFGDDQIDYWSRFGGQYKLKFGNEITQEYKDRVVVIVNDIGNALVKMPSIK